MATPNGPKLLSRYLEAQGLTHAEAASLFRVDRQRIYRLVKGERGPGIDLAFRIESLTEGAIPASAWRGRIQSRRRSAV